MYILSEFAGWCAPGSGLLTVFKIIKTCLNIIRFVVPIGLIIMTVLDVSKNVINPDDKDSMKKIGTRIVAAIIVFLVPTFVNLVMRLVDVGLGNNAGTSNRYNITDCWRNS